MKEEPYLKKSKSQFWLRGVAAGDGKRGIGVLEERGRKKRGAENTDGNYRNRNS